LEVKLYKNETLGETAYRATAKAIALHLALLGAPAMLALAPLPAAANCVTNGLTTTCDGATAPSTHTARIGEGPDEPDGRTVIVNGGRIEVGNSAAISLRDGSFIDPQDPPTIHITGGAVLQNTATLDNGLYAAGNNVIEFRSNTYLLIDAGSQVLSTGPEIHAEAVNAIGTDNLIVNNGLIRSDFAAALWFEAFSGLNTVVNNGTIQAPLTRDGQTISVLGSGDGSTVGASRLDFTNNGVIIGNLIFGVGDDILRLLPGQSIGGVLDGSLGNDQIFLSGLSGAGDGVIDGVFPGFEALFKNENGTWTITGAITGPTSVTIQAGTLIITGDNSAYAGSVTVDPNGTLQGRAQVLPQAITDNGLVRFAQTDDGTYAGLITGTGAVEKTGAGVLTLAPAAPGGNTYSGGTIITEGTLAIAADNAIGAATGPLTFNGGTLRYDAAFNLSASRAISITPAGGTIDTNGQTTTIAQGITGLGALTVDGPGNLILTGASTYAGGTTINTGARVQLGAGGTTGSITGNVLNNGTLAFSRSDIAIFAGVISGSGVVRQEGTGTTVLTGASTYTGGTTIGQGTLQLGNGGTTGSILGNVANAGTLAFNRSDTVTFAGVISGTGGVRQDGSGVTILSGANTYSGPTSVNAGILRAGATGVFSPASSFTVASGAELDLAGFDQTVAGLTNAGLVSLGGAPGTRLTVAGNYVGQGGVVALNTVLGADNSASDRLVINGGTATGDTRLRIINVGGAGAQTTGDGIRVVEATNGGSTAGNAFRLDTRVIGGAYEYHLFRGGFAGGSTNDWFLRNTLPVTPGAPDPGAPPGPGAPPTGGEAPPFSPADPIPLYRPEVAIYAPIPAIGRQMGLATLGTLHERVGEEENIRDLTGRSPYANGAWARVFGERTRNRWDGTVDARATGNLVGIQAGFDILRTNPYAGGHRDHVGVYVAYTDYNAPNVSGFALGQQNLRVGRLLMSGPSVGAYWTHFGPSGWYLDAVVQANWFDVSARSDFGTGLSTSGVGYTASLEAGYPIRFGTNWQLEPQAQIIYQSVSVDRTRDAGSTVDWDEGSAVTGRIGARLQYTGRDERTVWQPYAKVNLWHAFSGTDRVSLGTSAPIENRYGDTALEVGAGVTARINQTTSFYAHADYRWSLDGGRSRQNVTQGSVGIRFNW
jgi:outer membrane autotransporter protein